MNSSFIGHSNSQHFVRPEGYISSTHKIVDHDNYEGERCDALQFFEEWLRHGQQPYCAVLGEYGMGKTTTCVLLAKALLEKRKEDPSWPLPIYLDLRSLKNRDKSHEATLLSIIDTCLQHNQLYSGERPVLSAQEVIHVVQEKGAVVIFDGLDEVLVHLSTTLGQQFTRKLLSILPLKYLRMRKATMGRVLLSCRTHFFRTIRDQKTHLTTEDRSGIGADDYCHFNLLPFTTAQICDYLKHAVPHVDTDTLLALIQSVHNLSELAERPYTLSLIPSLIPQIEQWEKEGIRITGITIYRHVVLSWFERDVGKHTLTIHHKQQLMEHFAAELWRSGKPYWDVTDIENWFVAFLSARPAMAASYVLGQDENTLYLILEAMKKDLRTATFLVRVGESSFCFAHTSLQEFFLATYLYRALVENRLEDWNMPVVSKETLGFLGQLLSEEDNPRVLEALCALRDTYRPKISEMAFAYMMLAHTQNYLTPRLTGFCLDGANLQEWSIDYALGDTADDMQVQLLDLKGASFRGANLKGAYLRYLDLDQADFSGADLRDAEITDCTIRAAHFEKVNLSKAYLRHLHCEDTNFARANICQTEWVACYLNGSKNLERQSLGALFVMCHPSEQNSPMSRSEGFPYHTSVIMACTFSPDGKTLASASWDKTVRIWDTETEECLYCFEHDDYVYDCAYSADGLRILSAVGDTTLRVWTIHTGEYSVLKGHTDTVRGCSSSPSGAYYASASNDRTLRIWDAQTGECQRTLLGHTRTVTSCVFSPDSRYLVSASDDKTLRVWDSATGECLSVLTGHTHWVRRCAYSPNGEYIASASGDKTVRIWSAQTGECLHVLKGHEKRVRSCAFSPDGKYVVSTSDDQSLRVWDVETGDCHKILKGHQNKVRGCTFSPSGVLASASDDLTLKLWTLSASERACIGTLYDSSLMFPNL